MIRSLWIAKTGMEGQQTKLDAISHNLANVGTNGYKREGVQFEDLMYHSLRTPGAASSDQSQLPTGLQVGLGVRVAATARNFSQGTLQQTGSKFDIAIQGNGFFQVQLPDGSTGYTRDGSFQVDNNGQLVTNAGYPVMPGITVPRDATTFDVDKDGTVRVNAGSPPTQQVLGQLQTSSFVNPAGLDARGGNVYSETAASGTASTAAPGSGSHGTLLGGFVEGSNVNVVEELVNMIATQRAYELNSKAITTSDQMLQRLSQL